MGFVQPPCPKCGRAVFPIGDRSCGELCLRKDLDDVLVAASRARDDSPKDSPLRGVLNDIVDFAMRHPKAES